MNRQTKKTANRSAGLDTESEKNGSESPNVIYELLALARCYEDAEAKDQALTIYARALKIGDEGLAEDHPYQLSTLKKYSALLAETGHKEQAKQYKERAAKIRASLSADDAKKNQ